MWTLLFVVVNQIAYIVVGRIASAAAGAAAEQGAVSAGYTVYTNAPLLVMVPHAIVTVSLGTALLPQISAHASAGDLPRPVASWPGCCG